MSASDAAEWILVVMLGGLTAAMLALFGGAVWALIAFIRALRGDR